MFDIKILSLMRFIPKKYVTMKKTTIIIKLTSLLIVVLFVILLLTFFFKSEERKVLQTFSISDFSPRYTAHIKVLDDPNNLDEEQLADITIVDVSNNNTLIHTNARLNVEYDLKNEETKKSNVLDGIFGFQSIIIFDDFNCDGEKDIAVKTGYLGCYGAPSYNIYMGNNKGGFDYNQVFSDLTQHFCGFFTYSCDTKTIETVNKEGSIWHQFQTYNLVNGLPVLAKQVVFDDMYYPVGLMIESKWVDGKEITRKQVMADQIRAHQLLSLDLGESSKSIFLFESIDATDSYLYFVLVDKEDCIEYNYPEMNSSLDKTKEYENAAKSIFNLKKDANNQWIEFEDQGKKYILHLTPKQASITITSATEVTHYSGKLKKQQDLYSLLSDKKIVNLNLQK